MFSCRPAAMLVGLSLLLLNGLVTSQSTQPNIVIFVADDLGIGDVGCFGNDTMKTPNIDRIAREGVKLTHHLSAAAICTPSRAALLTGRYPIRSGMAPLNVVRVIISVSSTAGLPPNETTFAEVAQQHGYSTGLIGKWHLGVNCDTTRDFCHHPIKQGFDYFYGLPLSNARDFGEDGEGVIKDHLPNFYRVLGTIGFGGAALCLLLLKYGILPKVIVIILLVVLTLTPSYIAFVFSSTTTRFNFIVMRNFDVVEQPLRFGNVTQRLAYEGMRFIEKNNDEKKPFLLMMPFIQVHSIHNTSEAFRGHSKHGVYGDNVEELDWCVGEIVNSLEQLGILNNTLVYFTSDNGGHLEERSRSGVMEGGWNGIYRGGKGQGSMDGGVRVPTAAMWPGHFPAGTTIDVPTSQMDLFSSLSEAIFSEPLPSDRVIDGKNIIPLLEGTSTDPPHRFLFHYCGTEIHAARYVHDNGKDVYKLYYATPDWVPGTQGCGHGSCRCALAIRHDPPLLYNIGRDPSEIQQLSVIEYAEVVALINQAVANHVESIPAGIPSQFTPWKLLPRLLLQPCCNFPYCKCVDPVFNKTPQ